MQELFDLEKDINRLESSLKEKRRQLKTLRKQMGWDGPQSKQEDGCRKGFDNSTDIRETSLQTVIDAIPEPIMVINRDFSIALANRAVWRRVKTGFQKRKVTCHELSHDRPTPCSTADHPCPVLDVLRTKKPVKVEHVHYDLHGQAIHVEIVAAPILDEQGTVRQIVESSRDITDSKNSQVVISDKLEFLNTLIETIPSPIFYKDSDGRYLGCNSAFCSFLGKTKEQIIGTTVYDVAPKELAESYHAADLALMENRGIQIYETQVRYADNSIHHVVFNKAAFLKADGTVGGLVGVMADVTETKKTAKALAESASRFNAFMENLPALAFIKDEEGKYIYINRAVKAFYNQTAEQRLGKTDQQLWSADTAAKIISNDRQVLVDKQVLRTTEAVEVNGSRREHLVVKFPLANEQGPVLLAGVALDITDWKTAEEEKKALQRRLEIAYRMEALGTLAGGIAHDFNNILTSIMGYVDLAFQKSSDRPEIQGYLARVLTASQRARDLVKQVMAFSHQSDNKPRPVLLKAVVKEALKLILSSLPTNIQLLQQLNSEDAVLADPTNLHQVVMNLCANAHYAMKTSGGTLTVDLSTVNITDEGELRRFNCQKGRYLKLIVTDTGSGIAPENLERIFEPFFSTKPKELGSGMGLAVVHGIVKACQGFIEVRSTVGEGTCFTILLPAINADLSQETKLQEPLPVGNERILFVDDEGLQTDLAAESLGLLGYRVTAFTDSRQALAVFFQDPDRWDVVITDMTMPNLTGDALGSQILSIRPKLQIIIYTGYSENFDEETARKKGFAGFILKPLIIRDLAKLIRRIMDKVPEHKS